MVSKHKYGTPKWGGRRKKKKRQKFPVHRAHHHLSWAAQVQGLLGQSGSMCSRCAITNNASAALFSHNRSRKKHTRKIKNQILRNPKSRATRHRRQHHQKMAVVLNISTPTSKFWYPLLILSDFLNANKIHFPCVNNFPRELKKISKKKKWNIFHSMQMFQRERERDSLLLLFNRDRSPPLLLRLVASVVVVHRPPKSFLIYLFTMADKYGLSLSL